MNKKSTFQKFCKWSNFLYFIGYTWIKNSSFLVSPLIKSGNLHFNSVIFLKVTVTADANDNDRQIDSGY